MSVVPVHANANGGSCVLNVIRNALTGRKVKSDEITWGQQRLSDAQFEELHKFANHTSRPLRPGHKVEILSAEEMRRAADPRQTIQQNSAQDWLLLAESKIDSEPREVMRFRLHMDDGSVVDPGIQMVGKAREVDLSSAHEKLFNVLGGKVGGIDEIEIVHTHPFHPVRITDTEGRRYIRPGELSEGDILFLREYVMRFPPGKRITVKAVSPCGLNFSMTYVRGP